MTDLVTISRTLRDMQISYPPLNSCGDTCEQVKDLVVQLESVRFFLQTFVDDVRAYIGKADKELAAADAKASAQFQQGQ
jgi:hypothetical protein